MILRYALAALAFAALMPSARAAETVPINAAAPAAPFPHYWEETMGAGRAASALRADFQRDLARVKQATGLYYVRFHAIFHDELGVYRESQGKPVYNFQYTDEIYDSMLAAEVRPFVELGFMPQALAARADLHPFWYHPVVSPPKDYAAWDALITAFAAHLIQRYGEDEVARWYFEVWNEPNLDFWTGRPAQQTYYELYDHTARALKAVSPRLRVGGPATAHGAWLSDFIAHAATAKVPVDFITSHVYGNDDPADAEQPGAPAPEKYGLVCPAVARMHAQIAASKLPGLPLIVSEFNATYNAHDPVLSSPAIAAWITDTVRRCDGLTAMMSWWTFTDVFEEEGVPGQPMDGGFGLIGVDGIPKPAFAAFALLHRLGDREIATPSTHVIATRRADGTLVLAAYNPAPGGAPLALNLTIRGAGSGARIWRVDETHSNPMPLYRRMGNPTYPTADQVRALDAAADSGTPEDVRLRRGALALSVPAGGLALIEVAPLRH